MEISFLKEFTFNQQCLWYASPSKAMTLCKEQLYDKCFFLFVIDRLFIFSDLQDCEQAPGAENPG